LSGRREETRPHARERRCADPGSVGEAQLRAGSKSELSGRSDFLRVAPAAQISAHLEAADRVEDTRREQSPGHAVPGRDLEARAEVRDVTMDVALVHSEHAENAPIALEAQKVTELDLAQHARGQSVPLRSDVEVLHAASGDVVEID